MNGQKKMIYLDTHALIYLYAGELERFSKKGQQLIQSESLIVSGMAILELEYLFEIEKLLIKPEIILQTLQTDCGLTVCNISLAKIVSVAKNLTWTRDPFDRIIVANAEVADKPLLTKDKIILKNCECAIW